MPPIFTTVGYLQTQFSYLVPGPCGPPIQPRPTVERVCDDNGMYTLEFTQIFVVKTQVADDICHYFITTIVEQYHSLERCDTYQPPTDLDPLVEWFELQIPTPQSHEYPPPDYPRQWTETGTVLAGGSTVVCVNDKQMTYSVACVNGLLRVTRHQLITLAWPLPDGQCRKLQWTTEETFTTTELCEESDWVSMPPGQTGGFDLDELWKKCAGDSSPLGEPSGDGVLRVGMESDSRTPYRRAVRDVQRQEYAAGITPGQNRSRFVVLREIDGGPSTAEAMIAAAKKRKSVLGVSVEGSDFIARIPVRVAHAGQS